MKLAYMYATPDVGHSKVTAIQGDLEPTLEHIRRTGYTGVEFLVRDPSVLDVAAIEDAVAKAGLDVPAICTGEVYGEDLISFADPEPARRKEAIRRMKAAQALAERFGASVNVGRLRGRFTEGIHPDQTMDWIRQAVTECANAYPSTRIVIEPVNHQYANCMVKTADAMKFVEEINLPNVGLMLDMAHMLIEGEDLPASIRAVSEKQRLWHFHFTDSDRKPAGDGHYDMDEAVQALRAVSYDAYCTVETFQIPDSRYAIKRSYETLQSYFS